MVLWLFWVTAFGGQQHKSSPILWLARCSLRLNPLKACAGTAPMEGLERLCLCLVCGHLAKQLPFEKCLFQHQYELPRKASGREQEYTIFSGCSQNKENMKWTFLSSLHHLHGRMYPLLKLVSQTCL